MLLTFLSVRDEASYLFVIARQKAPVVKAGRSNLQATKARPAFFHRQQIASFLAMTGYVIDVSYRSEAKLAIFSSLRDRRAGHRGQVEAICNLQRQYQRSSSATDCFVPRNDGGMLLRFLLVRDEASHLFVIARQKGGV